MESANIEEFRYQASKEKEQSVHEKLNEGESAWLIGMPVPAEEGTIGLRTELNTTFIINEKEILELRKHNDSFMVRIKIGANIIIRTESITEFRATYAADEEEAGREAGCKAHLMMIPTGGDDIGESGGGVFARCPMRCTEKFEEHWCQLGTVVVKCLIRVRRCKRVCPITV